MRQTRPPQTPPPPPWGASPPCLLPPKAVAFRFCHGWDKPQPWQKLECPYLSAGAIGRTYPLISVSMLNPQIKNLGIKHKDRGGRERLQEFREPLRVFYRLARSSESGGVRGGRPWLPPTHPARGWRGGAIACPASLYLGRFWVVKAYRAGLRWGIKPLLPRPWARLLVGALVFCLSVYWSF